MTKKRVTILFLSSLTALSLVLCFIIFRPFITPLISASVLAIIFFPVHSRIVKWIHRPGVAAFLSTLLVLLIVVAPLVAVGLAIKSEVTALVHELQSRSEESGGWSQYLANVTQGPRAWISRYVDLSDVQGEVTERLQALNSAIVADIGVFLGGVTAFLVNFVITLFTLFFLLREGRSLRRRVAAVLPLSADQIERLFSQVNNTIIATVYGGLVVAAAQGTLTGLALAVLGIRSPVLWGAVAGFSSLVPLVGSAIVWLPAALYLVATGHWVQGLLLIAWGAGVVGTIDNVLRPLMMSGRVQMHTLLIFFSVLGGVRAFGFLGLFLGPVILAIAISLLSMLRDEARVWSAEWRENPAEPEQG